MPTSDPMGLLALVVHARAPWVRETNTDAPADESPLFARITSTCLPLLERLTKLADDGVPYRLSLALAPTLLHQLADPLLQQRYGRYLQNAIDNADAAEHSSLDTEARQVAEHRRDRLRALRTLWRDRYDGYLAAAFRELARGGQLELLASAATDAFLPLHAERPSIVRAQIRVGIEEFERCFGAAPRGFWLPEGGFYPGLDDHLAAAGIEYTVVAAHGLAQAAPEMGIHAPILCPSGLLAFASDPEAAERITHPETGYAARRLGDPTEGRDSERMLAHARAHATNFVATRAATLEALRRGATQPPILTVALSADLLGLTWREGGDWFEAVLRKAAWEQNSFSTATLGDASAVLRVMQEGYPGDSSLSPAGYREAWLSGENDWIYPYLDAAAGRMVAAAERIERPRGLVLRALDQAGRELLLAQSADWPAAMADPVRAATATAKFRRHLQSFHQLLDGVEIDRVDETILARTEANDNIFPALDYRVFRQSE
ncbi:MAG: 1,4-alpha-glucan branching protein domain-containing protein [Deltaproteobacteria bacterium]